MGLVAGHPSCAINLPMCRRPLFQDRRGADCNSFNTRARSPFKKSTVCTMISTMHRVLIASNEPLGSCCRWIRSCSARKFKWAISSSSSRISRVSQQKGLLGNLPRAAWFPCCTLWRRDWPASRDNLGSGSSTRTLLGSGFSVQVRWEMVLVQSTPSQRRCKFGGVKRTHTTAKPCRDCAEHQSDGPEQSAP
jgi:hypothetical protein